MKVIKTFLILSILFISVHSKAQTYLVKDSNTNTTVTDYKASRFGIKSDGRTLNTNSIQKAIDFINQKGGGRLVFYVGRYLTGSIQLKSNVIIHLEEGAVLVSPESIYDYNHTAKTPALVSGINVANSGITGKGVIEGNGATLIKNIAEQSTKGFINQQTNAPTLVIFDSCKNLRLSVQNYIDVAGNAIQIQNSSNITIDSAAIKCIATSTGKGVGITLSNCKKILVSNCFLDMEAPYINLGEKVENLQLVNVVTVDGKLLKVENNKIAYSTTKLR